MGDRAFAQTASAGRWQEYGTDNGEWRSYAGDIAGTKYSPLAQIDASNFSQLQVAWEWMSVDLVLSRSTPGGGEWRAPLDTVVDVLVAETPNLYREGSCAEPDSSAGDAVDGRGRPVLQHAAVAGGRRSTPSPGRLCGCLIPRPTRMGRRR